jgi:pimeloyl-ACP methyl ester carboxylesterase
MRRLLPLLAIGVLFATSVQVRAAEGDFDSNGVKIHYTDEGQGEPLILIHGFTGQGGFWMDPPRFPPGGPPRPPIGKELAKEYRVIAIDCRGHGKSDKPHDPKKYGAEMAEDVVRLLDHLKIGKAHVVGYSMGAFITLKVADLHPDRVLSATLGGAGWSSPLDAPLREEIAKSLEGGKGLGPLFDRLTPAGRPKPSPEQVNAINQMILGRNDAKALAAVMRGMKDLGVTEAQLKANQVPTLALIGEVDPLKTGVDAMKGKKPNLSIVVIEGADHMTAGGRPEFLKNLLDFLAKHRMKKAA